MSFILAPGDRLKIAYMCAEVDQLGINVVYYEVTAVSAGDPTDDTVAAAVSTNVAANYKALLNNEAEYVGVSVQVITPALRPSVQSFNGRGPGIAGADSLPTQVSGIITKVGSAGGRGRKGRMFVPFPATADNEPGGFPTDDYVNRLLLLADKVLQNPQTAVVGALSVDMKPIIFNPPFPARQLTVTSYVARQKWATQRRRGDYGRPNLIP